MPAHRSQRRRAYIEQERHDELSDGVPAPAALGEASQERRPDGTLEKGASTTPSKGGKAHKNSTRMSHRVTEALPVSQKSAKRAKFYRRKQCTELARTVGGGVCGMLASLLVKLASEDVAMREQALEEKDREGARKLGESARGHLMYAREVCAKDAQAAKASPGTKGTVAAWAAEHDESTEEKAS
jgi:hypothetical protein